MICPCCIFWWLLTYVLWLMTHDLWLMTHDLAEPIIVSLSLSPVYTLYCLDKRCLHECMNASIKSSIKLKARLHPNLPLIWTVNNFALLRVHCKDIQPRPWLWKAKAGTVSIKGLHCVVQLHQFVHDDILRLTLLNILQDHKHLAAHDICLLGNHKQDSEYDMIWWYDMIS